MVGASGKWLCSGASVVGRSHEREGLGCQDAWSLHRVGNVAAVCVCDGAGSAKNARAGAELVSAALAQWLARHFEKAIVEPAEALFDAVFAIRAAVGQRAASLASFGDYACTLVAVAVRDDGQWVAWHLGDGGIVAQFREQVVVLSKPKKGDFANVTQFVTDADAYAQVDCYSSSLCQELGNPHAFALFTDGIELSLFDRKTEAVAPAVCKMLHWHELADEAQVAEAIQQNLQDVFRNLTGDDCTLVLMQCVAKPAAEETQPVAAR